MLQNFQSLGLRDAVPAIIREHSAELVDYNLEQLKHGKTTNETAIDPMYTSKEYADYKSSRNPIPGYGVPDLNYTGGFYSGFFVKVSKTVFELGSTDEKSDFLEGKYSKNGGIFGLTNENKTNYAKDVIAPALFSYIKEKTGLPR